MLLALLLACTADKTSPTETADTAETGNETGGEETGGEADCPSGSHATDEGCEATLSGWTEGPSLNSGRDHHLTLIAPVDDHAVVLALAGTTARGGVNQKVERAELSADGALTDFEALADFEGAAIGQGLGFGDPGMVLVGGLNSSGNSDPATWVMQLSESGEPSFTAGPELLASRYHATASVHGGYVYVIGGMNQVYSGGEVSQDVLDSIERAPFDGTTLGAFEALDPLPEASTHHIAWIWGTGLYIAGGGSGARARDSVLRAELQSDGSLGAWEEVGSLPEGRATSAATVFLDHVYLVAGMAKLTGDERDTVLRAPLLEDGTVGAFEELEPLPLARAHAHQAPLWEGWMISAGGSISHEVQTEVYVGRLE